MYAPGPPLGTYRLRVPASRVVYVPEAQGGLPPGPHVQYVLGTRTSLGRWVRTAYCGTPGRGTVRCLTPQVGPRPRRDERGGAGEARGAGAAVCGLSAAAQLVAPHREPSGAAEQPELPWLGGALHALGAGLRWGAAPSVRSLKAFHVPESPRPACSPASICVSK